MAKKSEKSEEGKKEKAGAEAAPAKEKKKGSPRAKEEARAEAPPSEDKPAREEKGKGRKTEKKTSPEAPVGAPAPGPATAEAPAGEKPKKKKGKQPGYSPPLGKKLKSRLADINAKIARQGAFTVSQAVAFLKQNKRVKFDETVEVHMWLGVDPKQSDQMVRGSVALPHGIGKSVRLVVFAQGDNAAKAKEAGADHVGADELAKKIQGEGWTDFDVALATPDMMGVVGRLGKILGPRGLMPTPKAGTVITGDVAAAVREFKAGKVEFRADAGGNVHAPVGKLSFADDKLVGNINTFIDQVRHAKPSAAKGNYIKSITLTATMSPGLPVSA